MGTCFMLNSVMAWNIWRYCRLHKEKSAITNDMNILKLIPIAIFCGLLYVCAGFLIGILETILEYTIMPIIEFIWSILTFFFK